MFRHRLLLALLSLAIATGASAQTSPVAQSWSGWAQCQITIQAPGYSHSETHLWTTTAAGTKRANQEFYPTTWTVTGSGSLNRVSGPTRVSAQWQVNGTLSNIEIGTTLHLDRITIQRWTGHGPARGALTGSETRTTNGNGLSRHVVLDVQQWAFPTIATGTTSTRATGSNTLPFDGARGPMAPGGVGAMGSAACTWDFARGASSPSSPPAPAVTTPTQPTSGGAVSGGAPSGGAGAGAGGAGSSSGGRGGSAAVPITAELAITFFGPSDPSGLSVPSSWPASGNAIYGLGLYNFGPGAADGATITIPASSGLMKTGVSCNFQVDFQAASPFIPLNPTVAQIESGFVIATLNSGGYVSCTIRATVTGTAGNNVTMTVNSAAPNGVSDPNPGNNTATNTLPIR